MNANAGTKIGLRGKERAKSFGEHASTSHTVSSAETKHIQ